MPGPDDDEFLASLGVEPASMGRTRRTVLPEVQVEGTPEGAGSERMRGRGRVERGAMVDTSLPLRADPDTEARIRELATPAPRPTTQVDPDRQRRIDLNREIEGTSTLGDVADIANPFISQAEGRRAAERTGERLRNLWDEITSGDARLGGRNPIDPIVGRDLRSEAPIAGLGEIVTLGFPEETLGRVSALRDPIIRGARAVAPALGAAPGVSPTLDALAGGAAEIGRQPLEGERSTEERQAAMRERRDLAREQAPAATGLGETAGGVALAMLPGATGGRAALAQGLGMGAAGSLGASDIDITEDPMGALGAMVPGGLAGLGGAAAGQLLGPLARGPARGAGDVAAREASITAARAAAQRLATEGPTKIGSKVGRAVGGAIGASLGHQGGELMGLGGMNLGQEIGEGIGGRAEQVLRSLGPRMRGRSLEALQSLARQYPEQAARFLGNDTVRRLIQGASGIPGTSQAIPEAPESEPTETDEETLRRLGVVAESEGGQ